QPKRLGIGRLFAAQKFVDDWVRIAGDDVVNSGFLLDSLLNRRNYRSVDGDAAAWRFLLHFVANREVPIQGGSRSAHDDQAPSGSFCDSCDQTFTIQFQRQAFEKVHWMTF